MSRLIILAIVLVSAFSGIFLASAQQSDEEVRGAFLSSRPKNTNSTPPATRRRKPPQRQTNTSSAAAKNANTT
jgi:hypothetical protein